MYASNGRIIVYILVKFYIYINIYMSNMIQYFWRTFDSQLKLERTAEQSLANVKP
jgi:hypothetical protein